LLATGRRPPFFGIESEPAMTTLRFDDLRQYSDVLRSRSGDLV